jgi:hypothetical protein
MDECEILDIIYQALRGAGVDVSFDGDNDSAEIILTIEGQDWVLHSHDIEALV